MRASIAVRIATRRLCSQLNILPPGTVGSIFRLVVPLSGDRPRHMRCARHFIHSRVFFDSEDGESRQCRVQGAALRDSFQKASVLEGVLKSVV